MKVLVIGSGGREHALCWKIAQSPLVDELYCAPGNGGIVEDATCVNLENIEQMLDFARAEQIDLTVVGPEGPLTEGIVDIFEAAGLRIFGPNKAAARLEGSKAFAKEVMAEFGIPTAAFGVFNEPQAALDFIEQADFDVVVKADGLAAGKGVIVCDDKQQAIDAVREIMVDQAYGAAGASVVIEERLIGEEASFLAICDGEIVLPLASSQDHKAVFDGDTGPNTGGMGAYSPAPVLDEASYQLVMERVLYPLVKGLKSQGITFKGVIYAGIMMTAKGPQVLEFNARFGDPETQPLLSRLESDLVPVLMSVADGTGLKGVELKWTAGPAVCVVLASGGYPGSIEKGKVISGLEAANAVEGVKVFHAGTKAAADEVITSGGRVLGVTALGADLEQALARAYQATAKIGFEGMHYRKDIGQKAIRRMKQ